jgi:hypothetical protein
MAGEWLSFWIRRLMMAMTSGTVEGNLDQD